MENDILSRENLELLVLGFSVFFVLLFVVCLSGSLFFLSGGDVHMAAVAVMGALLPPRVFDYLDFFWWLR